MSNFSEKDRKSLESNPLVHSVGPNQVQFTAKFKMKALKLHSEGLRPSDIFLKLCVDPNLFLKEYPKKCISRWKKILDTHGEKGLKEERRGKNSTGRPKKTELKTEKALLERIAYLEATVDFFKKAPGLGRKTRKQKTFSLMSKALSKNKDLKITKLSKYAKVSRSGYYDWCKRPSRKMSKDEKIVINIFESKKAKAGYRTIKMIFERKFKRKINLKKIRRIKKDFALITRIRRKSKYRMIEIKGQEHRAVPDLVKRNFYDPNLILVDITEMKIMGGQKSYVFAMKNALTREIVGHGVSANPSVSFVTTTVEQFFREATNNYIIHSDQGAHFTSGDFRGLLQRSKAIQSMSRKGNCLDNAPIECFFGHLKDEVDYKRCRNVEELRSLLKSYVRYYNHDRPQWDLERKTPAEARVELGLVY